MISSFNSSNSRLISRYYPPNMSRNELLENNDDFDSGTSPPDMKMDIKYSSQNSNFPYVLKPPKVFVTRDFPEGCNAVISRVEGNENKTRSWKGKEVNSLDPSNEEVLFVTEDFPEGCNAVVSGVDGNENKTRSWNGIEVNSLDPNNREVLFGTRDIPEGCNAVVSGVEGNENKTRSWKGKEVNSPDPSNGEVLFVTRDFPEGCNAVVSGVEGNENKTRSWKGKEVNSLDPSNREVLFVTRDIPEGCNAVVSGVEGNENKTRSWKGKEVSSLDPSNSEVLFVTRDIPEGCNAVVSGVDGNENKTSWKGKEVNSLDPRNSEVLFVTRDIPEGCNAVVSGVKGNENNTRSLKGKEVNSLDPSNREVLFVTQDFPEGCNAVVSRVKGSENKTRSLKGKEVNSLAPSDRKVFSMRGFPDGCNALVCADVPTNTTTGVKGKNVISHAKPCSRNYVNEVNIKGAANLSVVPRDENNAKETLKLFREIYKELYGDYKINRKPEAKAPARIDLEAADILRGSRNWVYPEKRFGHIPGIEIGDKFHFRAELAVVGLHGPYISGIDFMSRNGKNYATSVVNSGRYENVARTADVLIYSGQGGQGKRGVKSDQKMTCGNLALVNSMTLKYPVRVIQKTASGDGDYTYTYDGLYVVNKYWQERDHFHHKLVFKFELHRISDQEISRCKERCVAYDVSQGKEKMAIRAMNCADGEKPGKFGYITKNIYPEWCKRIRLGGCDCSDGCSNSGQCVCVLKNGCEIPYSENGVILRRKGVVYECGPFCKCPSSCLNRLGQHGLRYQLEVYKIRSRGWGVRCRSYISSGSFVCEFVGKMQLMNEANQEELVDHYMICSRDEDGTGFIVDASKVGNVGRFIRHCKSPSLVARRVLYDHDDERMPHIMFFAAKQIPPLQELTCDYDDHWMMN